MTENADLVVLDTSAILTLIEDEDGADRVEALIRSGRAVIPWVVLLETHYVSLQEHDRGEADRRYALLVESGVRVLWAIDEPTLLTASEIKGGHGLSFADALIAAYARRSGGLLVHKDPEFEPLGQVQALEALPYKRR